MFFVPFKAWLNRTFTANGSSAARRFGGAVVGLWIASLSILRGERQQQQQGRPPLVTSPFWYLVTLGASVVLGASLGLILALKDHVARRINQGERVSPLLWLALRMGMQSVILWCLVVGFAVSWVIVAVTI